MPIAEVVVCAEGLHRTAFAPNPLLLLPRFFETGSWVVWVFFLNLFVSFCPEFALTAHACSYF